MATQESAMIQVTCPDCGYLQTLSEKRFLSIEGDYLICPHCHRKLPKAWKADNADSMPDDIKHKILAFSRRILNGGDISKEILQALEMQVRQYGAIPESKKALGIGYTRLGDFKKAEEFLNEAGRDDPNDQDILHYLIISLHNQGKYHDAVEIGEVLISRYESSADDQEVALLADSYLSLGNYSKAIELLQQYPHLDKYNPAVKMVNKKLNKISRKSFADFFKQNSTINKIFGSNVIHNPEMPEVIHNSVEPTAMAEVVVKKSVKPKPVSRRNSLSEYWIYSIDNTIPKWEDIRAHLMKRPVNTEERPHMFRFLEASIQSNDLTIDYIMRSDAPDFFIYPDDMLETNSRGFDKNDYAKLVDATMIVRVRYKPEDLSISNLFNILHLVEAIRASKSGIVQDAASHILWGSVAWKTHADDPNADFMNSHLLIEVLDEGDSFWVHTHGMRKFGYPELEIDCSSKESLDAARDIVLCLAHYLIYTPDSEINLLEPVSLPGKEKQYFLEKQKPDAENHFPKGSLQVHIKEAVEIASEAIVQKTEEVSSQIDIPEASIVQHVHTGRKSGSPESKEPSESVNKALETDLLAAHSKAVSELIAFKKSFQEKQDHHEIHAIKVGFPSQTGKYEWMWVTLESWRGKTLFGYIENIPVIRKDLRKGSRVRINEEDIFDWVIARSGAIVKGGYTEKTISQC
jgi:tetratricopeptide (TPR) repeat protein/uncharacterized protein YegJ (DUF2314 family)